MDSYGLFGAGWLAGFMISLLNSILKVAVEKTVKSLKLHTVSEEANLSMLLIFFAQLINTVAFAVLKNANFRDFESPILDSLFSTGHESDFNQSWYEKVGQDIIAVMIWNIWFPLFETFVSYLQSHLYRLLDRNLTSNPLITQQESILDYVELYSGPEFDLQACYSAMLLTISITFIFGAAMPILFPIALIHFTVTTVSQRLLVIYYYKEPPSFDEKMTLRCV